METSKRVVIVTGAARGIGRAIAEAFAANGDQPILCDLDLENAEKSAVEIAGKFACRAAAKRLDVADAADVERLIDQTVREWGRIDVIVNNAGLQHVDPIENFPVEKWDLLIGVMLKGPFLLTKYAIPHMKQRQFGRIINISSVHGKTASPFKAAYVSAKHGVVGLTRTAALETANDNITVNAVMPGTVRTSLIENQLQKLAENDGTTREEALQRHLLAKQALKRFIKPEEVAACCVFLASEQAAAITGETISVSGGW
ncbi:3-hydroxybutyrate dehydrogenase [Ferviditalea candida]|uniref:3-hydroxybutyrate dehydrogenase n=1 Tax=Ferviditalea candida TaxID=3108399 RepID=A0ABU5ZHI0_9BACL|nr:3-hydroxybutyrate dehydrogenase [Paenibacillaceae bacterium T2]